MSGRRIVLLGGAGGIGRTLLARLKAGGHDTVVMDLPASIAAHGLTGIGVDVTNEDSIAAAFAELDAMGGPVHGFVNLAGYKSRVMPLAETEAAYFDDIIAGNLRGAYLAAKAAMPRLVQDGTGSFVMVASGLAAHVRPGFGAYSAAKAAVVAMTKTLALEHAPKVRVNAVAPAVVDTAFLRGGTGRSAEDGPAVVNLDAYRAATPLQRVATPADIVGPIRFLLGPDSGFMTGQVLWVNGGGYMP